MVGAITKRFVAGTTTPAQRRAAACEQDRASFVDNLEWAVQFEWAVPGGCDRQRARGLRGGFR